MLIDTDGDGDPDSSIDLGESFQSGDFPLPDMDDGADELPGEGEVDEHGNRYVDTDNDGITDTIFCADGVVLPVKGSKIDEDGQRYYDSNEDGNYDILYDIDGTMHADYDENGIYDITIDKDGNVHYENGDGGIFEGEYEAEFGQG